MDYLETVTTWLSTRSTAKRDAATHVREYLNNLEHAMRASDTATVAQLLADRPSDALDGLGRDNDVAQFTAFLDGLDAALRAQQPLPHPNALAPFRALVRPRGWSSALPVVKAAAYVVPVIGAYVLGVYYRSHPGLYVTTQALLWPPYEVSASTKLVPNPAYEEHYYAAFARSYFCRNTTAFVRLTETDAASDQEPTTERERNLRDPGASRLRITLRNPTRAEPLLIGSITLHQSFAPAPFAWQRVEDTAQLALSQGDAYLTITDDGVGPNLNVRYRAASAGIILLSGTDDLLYHDVVGRSLLEPDQDVLVRDVTNDRLDEPFYRPATESDPRARGLCSDQWYETIDTLPRLQAFTKVAYQTPATLEATSESLRGFKNTATLARVYRVHRGHHRQPMDSKGVIAAACV